MEIKSPGTAAGKCSIVNGNRGTDYKICNLWAHKRYVLFIFVLHGMFIIGTKSCRQLQRTDASLKSCYECSSYCISCYFRV